MKTPVNNFEKVKELVVDGKLQILSIVSPSRTISTVLSRSISSHPNVSAEVLQPFHLKQPSIVENREEAAYKLILNAYEAIAGNSDTKPVTIITKEMARNLVEPEVFERWNAISHKYIFTIRNPLLAIESTIRLYFNFIEEWPEGLTETATRFAEKYGYEKTPEYFQKFPNIYAKHKGYIDESGLGQHWKVLTKHAATSRDYTVLGEVLEEFFPFYDLNSRLDSVKAGYIRGMNNKMANHLGYRGLNGFAKAKGNKNWQNMTHEKVEKKNDLEAFSPLLGVVFATSNTGWEAFRNILSYLDNDQRVEIIDGSILRALPESTAIAICKHLGLDTKDASIIANWGNVAQKPTFSDMENSHKAVFSRARASAKLELPTDTPIAPSRFPKQFHEHFSEVAMPAYIKSLSDKRCVRPRGREELTLLLNTQVADGRKLQDLDPVWAYGLISTDDTITVEKPDMLKNIEENAPGFDEVFALIDRINKDRLKTKYTAGSRKTILSRPEQSEGIV